jgi:hypothetical protein
MTTRSQKLIDRWNADDARWRRYEKLRIAMRSKAAYFNLSDEEIDDWAWVEATRNDSPLDCVGFVVERSR